MLKKFFYLFLSVFLLVSGSYFLSADDNAVQAPSVRNPMKEIGFYKDHVYDFKDIVNVDLETGAGIIKIPLASIKGRGVASTTLSISYKAYATAIIGYNSDTSGYSCSSFHILPAYASLNIGTDASQATKIFNKVKHEMSWNYYIPSLYEQRASEPYGMGPHGEFMCSLELDPFNLEFQDESGVVHLLYLTRNDYGIVPTNALNGVNESYDLDCYFLSPDGQYRSGIYHTRKDPHGKSISEVCGNDVYSGHCYEGSIYLSNGVKYTGLYNSHKLYRPSNFGVCDREPRIIKKQDLDGNWVEWDWRDSSTRKITNSESRTITITSTEAQTEDNNQVQEYTETISSSGYGPVVLTYLKLPEDKMETNNGKTVYTGYYSNSGKPWGDDPIGNSALPHKFLREIKLSDGSKYKFIYYHINEENGQDSQEEGCGTFYFGKEYYWTKANGIMPANANNAFVKEAKIYLPLLKKIILPTGGSIEFKYGLYGIDTETHHHEESGGKDMAKNFNQNLLNSLLGTYAYGMRKYGETSFTETFYIAHIGVRELIYRDTDGNIIEARKYKDILPYNITTQQTEDGLQERHYQFKGVRQITEDSWSNHKIETYQIGNNDDGSKYCLSSYFHISLYNGKLAITWPYRSLIKGRRVDVYDGNGNLISRQDIAGGNMNFNFLSRGQMGLEEEQINRERLYINYLHPGQDYSRKEIRQLYAPRLMEPAFGSLYINSGLIFKVYEEEKEIQDISGSDTIIKKTEKVDKYKGLDATVTQINDNTIKFHFFNESTHGLVLHTASSVRVYMGNGTQLENITSETHYNLSDLKFPWEDLGKSVPEITESVTTKQTYGNNNDTIWITKSQYSTNYPWRKTKEEMGVGEINEKSKRPPLVDISGWKDFILAPNAPIKTTYQLIPVHYRINYAYYQEDGKNGLLKKRTLSLQNGGTTQSTITEQFDYSYGVLSRYELQGTDGLSLVTTREIDPSTGWVKKQVNPDGTYTTYQYDRMGRLTQINSSVTGITDSQIQYIPYDEATHRPAQVKLSGLMKGHYYYDGFGRLKIAGEDNGGGWEWSKIDYLGLNLKKQEWSGAKAPSLNAISNWGAMTSSKRHYYDGFGREIKTETYKKGGALFSILETNYNGFFKTVTLKDAGGNIQEQKKVKYDAEDHIKAVWIRNDSGNLIKKLSYTYHPLFGKLTQANLYKEDGQTIGQSRTWDYDELGNLIKSVTPEEGQITYSNYNIFGKWGTKTYADGTTVNITYDGLGREKEIKSGSTILKTITYGTTGASIGKITNLTRNNTFGTVKTTYTYNQSQTTGRGLLTGKTYTINLPSSIMGQPLTITRTINYAYNSRGLLSSITYPAETISGIQNLKRILHFTYTTTGSLLKEISLSANGTNYSMPGKQLISNINYGAFGSISYTMGDNTLNQILNDSLGRLQKIESKFSDGNLLSSYHYNYDLKGNITTIKEDLNKDNALKGRDITYTYDNYNRLTGATYNQGTVRNINGQRMLTDNIGYLEEFAYDYAGNLIKKTFNNPSNYGFKNAKTFNIGEEFTNNRIPGGIYDGRGNLLKVKNPDREITLTYDPLNMVEKTETTIYSANNTTTVYGYIYDGDGKRIGKILINGGNAEKLDIYIRDNNGKILEQLKINKDENGNWQTNWFKDNYWVWDKLISSASAE